MQVRNLAVAAFHLCATAHIRQPQWRALRQSAMEVKIMSKYVERRKTRLGVGQVLLIGFFSYCTTSSLCASLVELFDKTNFSEDAVTLTFQELLSNAPAADAYSAYGVTFVSKSGAPLTLRSVPLHGGFLPPSALGIRNESPQLDDSLIVRFKDPVRRAGLQLDNISGGPETIASIHAFSPSGELLGFVHHLIPARPEFLFDAFTGTFLGIETDNLEGISTVVVSYDENQPVEQLNEILVDYMAPPVFRVYLPQVIQAAFGDLGIQTILEFVGSRRAGVTQQVTVNFFDSEGDPQFFSHNGEDISTFDFSVPANNFHQLTFDPPTDGIGVGYAVIDSNHPISVSARFLITAQELHKTELSAAATEGRLIHRFSGRRVVADGLDTAVALLNVGETEAFVSVFLDSGEGPPAAIKATPFFRLPAGAFRAFFLSELCQQPERPSDFCDPEDFLRIQDFQGSLRIRTSQPTVLLSLRTNNGLAVSLEPMGGSTQR